jgi:hypothetical protein
MKTALICVSFLKFGPSLCLVVYFLKKAKIIETYRQGLILFNKVNNTNVQTCTYL